MTKLIGGRVLEKFLYEIKVAESNDDCSEDSIVFIHSWFFIIMVFESVEFDQLIVSLQLGDCVIPVQQYRNTEITASFQFIGLDRPISKKYNT